MPRKLKSTALRSDAVTVANIPDGEITAAKLHTTAIQDKLGYVPASASTVASQLATLVDSAPTTLDTLNELAAALNDDANFATTVTNSLSGKVSKTGDTMTGNLTISKANPAIYLNDTTDDGVDAAIGVFGENFYVFEPEDSSATQTPSAGGRQWLRIEDDTDAYILGNRKIWDSGNAPNLGKVIKVTPYDNSTMITTSASTNFEIYSFNITKISSTSRLYITGAIPTSGSDNHGIYWYVSFNGTRKYAGVVDGLRSHGSISSTVPGGISINSFSQTGISAGTVSIVIGLSTQNSVEQSANRPYHYINPNSSVDGRNNSGTALTIWEVEA